MIVTNAVRDYLDTTRPPADPLLAEMQAHGERERIPILDAQSGALLHVLARAIGAHRVVEVGTAIGVSTLHLARALPAGESSSRSRSIRSGTLPPSATWAGTGWQPRSTSASKTPARGWRSCPLRSTSRSSTA